MTVNYVPFTNATFQIFKLQLALAYHQPFSSRPHPRKKKKQRTKSENRIILFFVRSLARSRVIRYHPFPFSFPFPFSENYRSRSQFCSLEINVSVPVLEKITVLLRFRSRSRTVRPSLVRVLYSPHGTPRGELHSDALAVTNL